MNIWVVKYLFLMNLIIIVLSICLKSCAKNGNHGWVPSVTSIAAASNIGAARPSNLPVQCTEINYDIFTSVPDPLESKKKCLYWKLLQVLSLCHFKPAEAALGGNLQLLVSDLDYTYYRRLIILSTIKVMKQEPSKRMKRCTSRRNFDMDFQYI